MRNFIGGFLLCLGMGIWMAVDAADPPGVYQAPDPEPTPEETLILEFINRCRADPMADALRIAPPTRKGGSVDYDMFRKEMSEFKPAPPLVMDLTVLKAARWHSSYQIINGQGHDEDPTKKGFSGASPGARITAAGFEGRGWAENVFVQGNGPWHSHEAFIIDWGEGPGGMQPGRGHRANILNPSMTVIGPAAVPHGSLTSPNYSVTHNFSVTSRRAGGVVYDDKNRNHFYDIGEGLGGFEISSGDQAIKTWKSGAYALPISDGEVKLSVMLAGKKYSKLFTEGSSDNIKFDVILPSPTELAKAEKLLASTVNIPDDAANAKRRYVGLVRLLWESQEMLVDDETQAKIAELTSTISQDLQTAMKAVETAMAGNDMAAARAELDKQRAPFLGTVAAAWFLEGVTCVSMKVKYLRYSALKADGKPVNARTIQQELTLMERSYQRLKSPFWQNFLKQLGQQMVELTTEPT